VPYQLKNVPGVQRTLDALKNGDANDQAKLEKVRKALRLLRQDPRHPGLNTYPLPELSWGRQGCQGLAFVRREQDLFSVAHLVEVRAWAGSDHGPGDWPARSLLRGANFWLALLIQCALIARQ